MIITYIIEVWNPMSHRYNIYGRYNSLKHAEIMMFKPYMKYNTSRLIRISSEILYAEKKGKK